MHVYDQVHSHCCMLESWRIKHEQGRPSQRRERHDTGTLCHPAGLTHLDSISFSHFPIFFLLLYRSYFHFVHYLLCCTMDNYTHSPFLLAFTNLFLACVHFLKWPVTNCLPHVIIQYILQLALCILLLSLRGVPKRLTVIMSACVQSRFEHNIMP